MRALAVRQVKYGSDRVDIIRIKDNIRAHVESKLPALRRCLDGDHACSHGRGKLCCRQSYRTLPEDGDGFVAAHVYSLESGICRAGATGNGCSGLERQICRQRKQSVCGYFHVTRVSAVTLPRAE